MTCWSHRLRTLLVAVLVFRTADTAVPAPPDAAPAATGHPSAALSLTAVERFDYGSGSLIRANGGAGWNADWQTSRMAPPVVTDTPDAVGPSAARSVLIRGTGDRNNPLRRELQAAVRDREVFVRFDLRYDSGGDSPETDPEFFVLWLDRIEGGDTATHAQQTPNIGLHVADRGPLAGRTVFMVRVGPQHVAWSPIAVREGQTYTLVARLAKSDPAADAEYDRLDLWIDPSNDDDAKPQASVTDVPSLAAFRWLGFSTGRKTEPNDRILISDIAIAGSWDAVMTTPLPFGSRDSDSAPRVVWNERVDFTRDVFPLLRDRCFDCHSGEHPDSGFRLDRYPEIRGYSTGNVLAEPGRSHASRLIAAVSATDPAERMPPDGLEPLNETQIALLRAWIDQGLSWDEQLLPTPPVTSDHWAFRPVQRPAVPDPPEPAGVLTPVDAFIAQAQADAGISPGTEADRTTLVRRLYLDLLGLPPTPDEVDAFCNDTLPAAYERLVERLLASPHYGERWGRLWLDLARWAESQGYQHDFVRPYAWRYRDYVIDSFNNDKPYDRFLREQIAGDELEPYSDENLIATGFLAAARISGNQEDPAIQRNDMLVDIVNATGSAVLGLTLECAQCHNHKFDPVTQRDYYRMQAFFVKGQPGNLSLQDPHAAHPTDLERWIPKAAWDEYSREVKSLTRKKLYRTPDEPHTWGFLSAATGHPDIRRFPVVNRKPLTWSPLALQATEARMLIRGDAGQPGPRVTPGWPEVLGPTPELSGPRVRSALVDWLTDRENPLVARVWVNRIWQSHFGRGLVETSGNFGVEGTPPSHPELLDWLAAEFMDGGWSTHHLHRQIVLSATYRQRSRTDSAARAIDPDNRLLWTWPRRRLEAEAIRDAVLVASGELNRAIGGVSVPSDRQEQNLRRTIYLFQQRSRMPSVMAMFDAPDAIASCSRRAVSTVALQPLYLLNSDFMTRRAAALADAVRTDAGSDPRAQIRAAFRRTLSRTPDDDELQLALQVLQPETSDVPRLGAAIVTAAGATASPTSTTAAAVAGNARVATSAATGTTPAPAADDSPAWSHSPQDGDTLEQLCHALLNLNEFFYIP